MDLRAVDDKPINIWVMDSAVVKYSGGFQPGCLGSQSNR